MSRKLTAMAHAFAAMALMADQPPILPRRSRRVIVKKYTLSRKDWMKRKARIKAQSNSRKINRVK